MEDYQVDAIDCNLYAIKQSIDELINAVNRLKSDDTARWAALITAILCLRREYDMDGDLSPVGVQDAQEKAIELLKKMKKKSRGSKPEPEEAG